MASPVRIKRRSSGAGGAPGSLLNAELAYNEIDDILYYGKGTGGAGGSATTIEAIAGKGAVLMLTTDQAVSGTKTFSNSPVLPTPTAGDNSTKAATTAFVQAAMAGVGTGDMLKSTYDTNNNGVVDNAERLGGNLANTYALLASPALTGTPTAPTATAGTNTTQLASTAFVQAAIAALINSSPGALDTLQELAAALGNDPNFAATITTALAGKLAIASNLSDLANVATARANLGLGTMATQAANNVAITGGTIDGVTIDGGTF